MRDPDGATIELLQRPTTPPASEAG
jgi:hypothetical protein